MNQRPGPWSFVIAALPAMAWGLETPACKMHQFPARLLSNNDNFKDALFVCLD
jgi:hypothetical protein